MYKNAGDRRVGDQWTNSLFINSEQVGSYVTIRLPGFEGRPEKTRIHYLESGVGEPLLLIHGIGQSLYTWRSVFPDLSDNYRVIAIDLPGHGYSDRPESLAYSMDEMAHVIKLFLAAKHIESAHMVGFSTGAMYMLRFLSLYPDCVANCIAIAPGGITDDMPKLVRSLKNRVKAVFARNLFSASDVRKLLLQCVSDPAIVDDRMVKQYYLPLSDGLSREAVMYAVQNFDMDAVAEGLMPVDHEVLVLWGKEDAWHEPSSSVYFQGVLQSGRYYLIRNTGHLLQEENPHKLLEVIFSYIPPVMPNFNAYQYTQYPEEYAASPADAAYEEPEAYPAAEAEPEDAESAAPEAAADDAEAAKPEEAPASEPAEAGGVEADEEADGGEPEAEEPSDEEASGDEEAADAGETERTDA